MLTTEMVTFKFNAQKRARETRDIGDILELYAILTGARYGVALF